MNIHPEYIVDEQLNKKSVIIPYAEWKEMLEEIEKLNDIRAYDRAKRKENNETLPFDQAVAEIMAGKVK